MVERVVDQGCATAAWGCRNCIGILVEPSADRESLFDELVLFRCIRRLQGAGKQVCYALHWGISRPVVSKLCRHGRSCQVT